MENFSIAYKDTNRFSKLVIDYINKESNISSFVNNFPTLDNFEKQIKEKSSVDIDRNILFSILEKQNALINLSELSKRNIRLLKKKNSFTVTTGHQLCLFTGPLYFIYKIVSTINLAEKLTENFPNNNFIPIFWMASEDHDFEEINHINLFGNKLVWDSSQRGPVGKMETNGIDKLINELRDILGDSRNAKDLLEIFENSYLRNKTLSEATRYLVNKIFGRYGIVIIDGNDKVLKKQFIPQIKKDLLEKGFFSVMNESSKKLSKTYSSQAFVRDINFFRLSKGNRSRITNTIDEIEINESPDVFSPNVLLRPLYQEIVLPNIAVVGGGAEIAYWLQLRSTFKQEEIPFPLLVLRNSVMLITKKQINMIRSFNFNLIDIFKDEHFLQKQYILSKESSNASLINEKESIKKLYEGLLEKTDDKGLESSIRAQLKKQLKVLDKLESKIIKIEKERNQSQMNQISKIKQDLFPNNVLQERQNNFIPFYLKDGDNFLEILKNNLNPLDPNFVVLCY